MSWKIKYYQTTRGDFPVYDFIEKLDIRTNKKVKASIEMLERYGPYLTPPYMKKLIPNLYELRIKTNVAIRVFYSPKRQTYYLLHAFIKKSQKTPPSQLHLAVDRMKELI